MKSIIQPEKDKCFLCGKTCLPLCTHHVIGGALRSKADQYGLTVYLCPICHLESPESPHKNKKTDTYLKVLAEEAMIEEYGWTKEKFIQEFRKNYI